MVDLSAFVADLLQTFDKNPVYLATLRDKLAVAALPEVIRSIEARKAAGDHPPAHSIETAATISWALADEMMRARSRVTIVPPKKATGKASA